MVSGASPPAFWAAHLLWDAAAFSLPAAGMLALFWQQHLPQFQGQRMAALAAVLWAFGLASLPLTYLLAFFFSDEMRALQRLNTLYFLVGCAAVGLAMLLALPACVPACLPPSQRVSAAGFQATEAILPPAPRRAPLTHHHPHPPPLHHPSTPAATWASSPAG
jgi:hypothetical protein